MRRVDVLIASGVSYDERRKVADRDVRRLAALTSAHSPDGDVPTYC